MGDRICGTDQRIGAIDQQNITDVAMNRKKDAQSTLLASDSDWHNNACLNYMRDHGTAYTEGYRKAADILIRHIDESGRDQDFLVYPVLFLYRHHIELLIKQIIELALPLAEEPEKYPHRKDDHNLNTLWPLAQKLVLKVDDRYKPSDFRIVKEVVKELHDTDHRATDFRYARRNDGTRSLDGIRYVNTRLFGEKMGAASDCLDGIDANLRYLQELDADMG